MRALLLVALLGLLARVQGADVAAWGACVPLDNCQNMGTVTTSCVSNVCVPDCGELTSGMRCYDFASVRTCDDTVTKLDAGLKCTTTSAPATNGVVAALAAWGACDSSATSVDTCPGIQTCISSFCRPDCEDLLEGQKCYDGTNKVLCDDGTFPTTAGLGCTTTNINQDSVMMAECDINSLCANTASPNNVCYDAGSAAPWAPCPTDLVCVPDSTNSAGTPSAQSYCRAECTAGSKTGLLSFQCRQWGKNTCWCPADTSCDVMTTPPVDGRTATVGSWANTYCTPASSYPEIDLFMSGLTPTPTCPTVTMTFQATGIPAFTQTYEQCRRNGVPICACSAGVCDVFNEPITGRKVGTWSNTYCTVPV